MPNLAQKMLNDMRADKIQQAGIRVPTRELKTSRTLENQYAVKLRAYQKEINKQLLEVLQPIINTYRQDATTQEIEATTKVAQEVITNAILTGAVLSNVVSTQGSNILSASDKKYSADMFTVMGFNSTDPDITSQMIDSWKTENVKLIKGVNDDQIKSIETLLLRAGREGTNKSNLTSEIQKIMKSSVKRATLIAVDQVLKLDGQIDRMKQTEAGVSHFIWRTAGDERVRPKHRALNGKKFSWKTGADGLYPKQEVRCRCWAEPSFEEILGPEYKAAPAQPIKEPMPKKAKKPKEKKETSLKPVDSIKSIKDVKPPKKTKRTIEKPDKRDSMTSGRARLVARLNENQKEFDQNARWISSNPKKTRKMATVKERSQWLHWEWVHGSNRKASVNMKQAAKQAFGLRGTVFNPHGLRMDFVDDLMISDIKKIHKATQGQLKKRGIKKIKLYRGINSLYTEPGAIESWTSDPKIAKKFGKHVMEQEFDASRILDYKGSVNWTDGAWGNQSEYMVMR